MKLIAIIPTYNEESTIGDVIKTTFVDDLLVINHGSTEGTTGVMKMCTRL